MNNKVVTVYHVSRLSRNSKNTSWVNLTLIGLKSVSYIAVQAWTYKAHYHARTPPHAPSLVKMCDR